MATALKRLGLVARVATQRTPCTRPVRRSFIRPQSRPLSTTISFRAQNVPDDDKHEPIDADEQEREEFPILPEDELPEELYEDIDLPSTSWNASEQPKDMDDELAAIDSDMETEMFDDEGGLVDDGEGGEPRWPPGFFSLEEERDDPGEDPEFENDDITSMAHGELEQHRELREFARVMVWDMPLLFNHARAFEAPSAANPIRFRYTTYMGETHPASRKVVMTFSPSALPNLTEIQSSKLIKLLGVRYNPSTTSAKLSCELYPTAAQNKRYLGDLLDKLITEAKDAKDTFEDVPFDFRHHKPKKRYLFPEEWKLTEERRKQLEARREEKSKLEQQRSLEGGLVQGTLLIEEMMRSGAQSEKEAVLQMATGMEQKGKAQKKRATRL